MEMENAVIKIDKQKVQELMEVRGINSFAKLADAASVHPNTVYKVLSGDAFDSNTLAKLATALQCQPTDLLTWNGFVAESFSPAQVSL